MIDCNELYWIQLRLEHCNKKVHPNVMVWFSLQSLIYVSKLIENRIKPKRNNWMCAAFRRSSWPYDRFPVTPPYYTSGIKWTVILNCMIDKLLSSFVPAVLPQTWKGKCYLLIQRYNYKQNMIMHTRLL